MSASATQQLKRRELNYLECKAQIKARGRRKTFVIAVVVPNRPTPQPQNFRTSPITIKFLDPRQSAYGSLASATYSTILIEDLARISTDMLTSALKELGQVCLRIPVLTSSSYNRAYLSYLTKRIVNCVLRSAKSRTHVNGPSNYR